MPDLNAAECRSRADVCQCLVGLTPEPERRALWVKRTTYWEQLALEADKQSEAAVTPVDPVLNFGTTTSTR
jgi:hypothetical protein